MPRRRTQLALAHPSAEDSNLGVESEPALDQQLATFVAQFGDARGYRVRIDRRDARGNPEYLGTMEFVLDLEDQVAQRWGGGKYRARIVDGEGSYKASISFGVAGSPRDPDATRPASSSLTAEPTGMDRLASIIAEGQRNTLDAIRELAKAIAGGGGSGDSVDQVVKVAKALREVAGGNNGGGSSTSEALAVVREVLKLRSDLLGEDGDAGRAAESDLAVVVRDGLKPLLSMAQTKMENDRAVHLARLEAQRAAGATVDPVVRLAARIPVVARHVLLQQAQRNAEPSLYAELALDQLPGDVQDELPALLALPDFVDRLLLAIPAFAPYRDWFAQFATALRELLTDDADKGEGEASAGQQPETTQGAATSKKRGAKA